MFSRKHPFFSPSSLKLSCNAIILTCFLIFIGSVFFYNNSLLVASDSAGYIGFHLSRPVGYPLFLAGIQHLCGSLSILPYFQLLIYYVSMAYLMLSVLRITHKWLYLTLIFIGLNINYPFVKMAYFILPESLSISFLFLILGSFIRFFSTKQLKYLIYVSIFIGLGILCKPVFKFLLILPLLIWSVFYRSNVSIKRVSKIYIPVLLLILLGSGVQYFKNGFFGTESFFGHNLLGKAGLIAQQGTPSQRPGFMYAFEEASFRLQAVVKQSPSVSVRFALACPLYDQMRYYFLGEITHAQNLDLIDNDYKNIAVEIIKHNPIGYAQDVFLNYVGAWLLLELRTEQENKDLLRLIKENEKNIPQSVVGYFYGMHHFDRIHNTLLSYAVRFFMGLTWLLSLYFLVVGFYKGIKKKVASLDLLTGFTASCIIQGGIMVVSIMQAGIPRYVVLFWPCIILILVLGFREFIKKVLPTYEKS